MLEQAQTSTDVPVCFPRTILQHADAPKARGDAAAPLVISFITREEEARTNWYNTTKMASETGWNPQYLHKILRTDAARFILGARRKFTNRFLFSEEALPWVRQLHFHTKSLFSQSALWFEFAEKMANRGRTLLDYDHKTGGYIFGDGLAKADDVFVYLMTRKPEDVVMVGSGTNDTMEAKRPKGEERLLLTTMRDEMASFKRDFEKMVRKAVADELSGFMTNRDNVNDDFKTVDLETAAVLLGVKYKTYVSRLVRPVEGRRGQYRLSDIKASISRGAGRYTFVDHEDKKSVDNM